MNFCQTWPKQKRSAATRGHAHDNIAAVAAASGGTEGFKTAMDRMNTVLGADGKAKPFDGDELDALVARLSLSPLVQQAFWSPSSTE